MTGVRDGAKFPGTAADDVAIANAAARVLRNKRPLRSARLKEAAEALGQRAEHAERLLSRYLEHHPDDADALLLLAEARLKLAHKEQALDLLARAIIAAPEYEAARFVYASTLYQLNRLPSALAELTRLLAVDAHNVLYLELQAAVLRAMGRYRESMLCRRQLAEGHPNVSGFWTKYGKDLVGVGERDSGIDAIRRAIQLNPVSGSAWWALADLKSRPLSESEIGAMETVLADATGTDRMYIHFALGRAYAHRGVYARAFDHTARGNAMKRLTISYDPDWLSNQVAICKRLYTRRFFEGRAGSGSDSAAPIFVVGMQRSGSTLVEQILDSHSAVEATAELPDITLMAERLAETVGPQKGLTYPGIVAALDDAFLRKLGEEYLESTCFRRRRGVPFFVDKNPYNFLHLGLIRLILPNARVIDVRRHPLACCWSNFSAHFETGALFAYRLNELGRAYAEYVALMVHFDSVLPGRITRVICDDLVATPEKEIRRLLKGLGLPFEKACLEFHENTRAMDSVSADQVRRPLSCESLERWRPYEPWLAPLKSALGPALEKWR